MRRKNYLGIVFVFMCVLASAQDRQQVEGFDTVVFHYNGNRSLATIDYRGSSRGYMTAAWWAVHAGNYNLHI
jgi:hypothetical protein